MTPRKPTPAFSGMMPIRLHVHRFPISRHPRGSLLLRSMATKSMGAYPSSAVLVWLFLVAILVGNLAMTSAAGADTRYDWRGTAGGDHRRNTPPQARASQVHQLREAQLAAAQPGRRGVTEQPGRPGADPDPVASTPMPPGGGLRPIIVEAMLNQQVSVPLVLDTGATYTVLTRQTAQSLGITGLERLPKRRFLTPGGPIQAPVATLKSIRVGTAEVLDVAVAIDIEGHLPMGLLGMTFMRHFKVTVDQVQGQARFERSE